MQSTGLKGSARCDGWFPESQMTPAPSPVGEMGDPERVNFAWGFCPSHTRSEPNASRSTTMTIQEAAPFNCLLLASSIVRMAIPSPTPLSANPNAYG